MATPLISPLSGWAQAPRLKNWAGNLTYSTDNVQYPKTVEEVQEIVKKYSKLKALGTRHCFNTIADSKKRECSRADTSPADEEAS